ncbi:hypothetical protein GCM10009123_08260 [Kangiella japonica]|uniref:Protein TonB n=1 Tax=Kangiella japonica TaxID=647384 RepID=A0ABN0SW40_9GAMM
MLRVIVSALFAFGIVVGLFLLMNFLITSNAKKDEVENIRVEVAFVEEDKQVQRKERRPPKKPPPPKEPPPPQQQVQQKQQKVVTAIVDIKIDNIDASMDGTGIYIGGLGSGQDDFSGMGDGEAIPVYMPQPEYPVQANLKGIEGYVLFTMDIGPDGSPSNISVEDESPRGVFRRNALRAIRKWKFKPRIVNGQPIHQRNMRYRMEFKLDQ